MISKWVVEIALCLGLFCLSFGHLVTTLQDWLHKNTCSDFCCCCLFNSPLFILPNSYSADVNFVFFFFLKVRGRERAETQCSGMQSGL